MTLEHLSSIVGDRIVALFTGCLWLSGDLLLQHHYLPGGSVYALDAIAEAASADLGSWRSLISGEVRHLSS